MNTLKESITLGNKTQQREAIENKQNGPAHHIRANLS